MGVGQPLIILHGLFGSSRNWQQLGKRLAAKHQVYLLDLRNHGRSPHDDRMDYERMAEDLAQFVVQHDLSDFHLLGHSMGGKVAMLYALAQGQQVASLTVVDIAPVAYEHDFAEVLAGLKALDLTRLNGRKQADAELARYVKPMGLRQFLLQNLVLEQGVYHWRIHLAAIEREMSNIAGFPEASGSYLGTTLFVKGSESDYIGAEHESVIHSYFPYAQIDCIEGAGHWLHAEQPEAFLRMLWVALDD